jgi:hypothetical protein
MGTAYLANCPDAERDHLIRLMRQQGHSSSNDAKFEHEIAKVVDRVRMLGYGLRQGKLADDSSSIVVPIMSRGRVAGVVSMTMFKRSLDESAFWRFPPPQSFTKSPGVAARILTFRAAIQLSSARREICPSNSSVMRNGR